MATTVPAVRISPDARLTIEQTCEKCEGRGFGDVDSYCSNCGHHFTQEEMCTESGLEDSMACGCPWRHRHEDDTCGDCEGTGKVHKVITLRELAAALREL